MILYISIIAAVMGSFTFGWNTGVINNPEAVITAFINATLIERGTAVDDQLNITVSLIWSIIVSGFALSGMFGGLLAGLLADKFGRIRAMLITAVISLIAAPIMAFSKLADSFEMIIIGRLMVGFSCGLYTGLVPVYLAEISPKHLRGSIGTLNQLGVVSGIFISQVIGLKVLLGTESLWPVLLVLTALPSIFQLVLLPLCPESPRFLLISRDQAESARSVLKILRGDGADIEKEIEEMQRESTAARSEPPVSLCAFFTTPHLRKALLVAIVLHLSQQLCGIVIIFYYSANLFTNVGIQNANYATLGVGGILIIMTGVSVPLMEKLGRRILHLTGLFGIILCSIVFTVTFSLQEKVEPFKYVTVVSTLVFVIFFSIGPGSIPWMIVSEMFSQGARPTAVAIGVAVNWSMNFIVGLTFLTLFRSLFSYVLLPYCAITTICFVILYFFMPETKDRTFEEMTAIFTSGSVNRKPDEAPVPISSGSREALVDNSYL